MPPEKKPKTVTAASNPAIECVQRYTTGVSTRHIA